ncbi:MAG TPA: response regulator [Alphaproteobacteria bacterium]|nr:response regulator [Alphaproteobacteria bacterium]HOO50871.1 response regulator [Alphaproteobacteria bacterium]
MISDKKNTDRNRPSTFSSLRHLKSAQAHSPEADYHHNPLAGIDELNVLVVEDSESDFYSVKRLLTHHMPWAVRVMRADTLADAEAMLHSNKDSVHIVLLDLGLPDSDQPTETYSRISHFKDVLPIVVLTSFDDHQMALDMIGVGAQDYVCKNLIVLQPDLLGRTIEFAIGRHQNMSSSIHEVEKRLEQTSELLNLMSGAYSVGH